MPPSKNISSSSCRIVRHPKANTSNSTSSSPSSAVPSLSSVDYHVELIPYYYSRAVEKVKAKSIISTIRNNKGLSLAIHNLKILEEVIKERASDNLHTKILFLHGGGHKSGIDEEIEGYQNHVNYNVSDLELKTFQRFITHLKRTSTSRSTSEGEGVRGRSSSFLRSYCTIILLQLGSSSSLNLQEEEGEHTTSNDNYNPHHHHHQILNDIDVFFHHNQISILPKGYVDIIFYSSESESAHRKLFTPDVIAVKNDLSHLELIGSDHNADANIGYLSDNDGPSKRYIFFLPNDSQKHPSSTDAKTSKDDLELVQKSTSNINSQKHSSLLLYHQFEERRKAKGKDNNIKKSTSNSNWQCQWHPKHRLFPLSYISDISTVAEIIQSEKEKGRIGTVSETTANSTNDIVLVFLIPKSQTATPFWGYSRMIRNQYRATTDVYSIEVPANEELIIGTP